MDDLVRWLGKQLSEDEAAAERTLSPELRAGRFRGKTIPHWKITGNGYGLIDEDGGTVRAQNIFPAEAAHVVRHDPARVLREIEAKRAVVARYEFACREASRLDLDEGEREMWIRVGGALQSVVIQLAAPYADRPGYRAEEWAP